MTLPDSNSRTPIQQIGLIAGILCALFFVLAPKWGWQFDPNLPLMNPMAGVLAIMAIWWITEAIPIAVTALLPLVLFPTLKIPPGSLVAKEYGHPLIFLFLGGFLIALAIENSGLHRRVALRIIVAVGDTPRGIVLGFMLASGLLSMWLSNTATTIMLLPIALNVLEQSDATSLSEEKKRRFGIALMLGLAYSASIGGIATIVGTPPNIIFKAFYDRNYSEAPPINFSDWLLFGVPFSIVFLIITWLFLTRVLFRLDKISFFGGQQAVRAQLTELGPMRVEEWRMMIIFLTTALLWILREPTLGYGWGPIFGWGKNETIEGSKWVDEGTVAVLMAIVCFIVPAGGTKGREPLLNWAATKRLPWGILLLFGGGLALGSGMKSTELDQFLGGQLAQAFSGMNTTGILFITASSTTFMTEITSNLACINILLPVLKGASDELGINALQLMLTATLSSSCAFMLPVATAPNAIVYGSGRLRMWDMVKAGFWLNWIGVALIVLLFSFW